MADLPPLPPGATLLGEEEAAAVPRLDPAAILKREGFVWTNGYRTEADIERIRRQGYNPSPNSAHLKGDALDLTHPKLSPAQQKARLEELFGDWEGASVLDEGHHRHLKLPGWHGAPGTPGTPYSGIPALPEGAELVQRGALTGDEAPSAPEGGSVPVFAASVDAGAAPAERSRVGIAPAINAVTDAITGKEPVAVIDSTGTIGGFADELPEETRRKLTPEQLAGYVQVASDPNSTPADLERYFAGIGWTLGNAAQIVEARRKGGGINKAVAYQLPIPEKNTDGAVGSAARGFADPVNFLDEMGAVVDTLGGTDGRQNVWNSDASFGDILDQNIDLNRGIIAADERDHPYARLGGQFASGFALPYGGGVRSVAGLAKLGAAEGAVAGLGAGEGNIVDRLPNAVTGAAFGAVAGPVLGKTFEGATELGRRGLNYLRGRAADEAADAAVTIGRPGDQDAGRGPLGPDGVSSGSEADDLTEAAIRDNRTVGMDAEPDPEIVGPVGRQRDYINLGDLPPLPNGATLVDNPLGSNRIRQMREELGDVQPEDLKARPSNRVDTLDEALRANPGRLRDVEAPDDIAELRVRTLAHGTSGKPVKYRGPIDAVAFLRLNGGLKDYGGELRHIGITNNKPRSDNRQEWRIGPILNKEGLSLDEAGERLWEAGYVSERPTVGEVLDIVRQGYEGRPLYHNTDYEELARFRDAQAERGRVEMADPPLAEEVGQPVTAQDLEANRPPDSAYLDTPEHISRVASINLEKLYSAKTGPKDIRAAFKFTSDAFNGFESARRSVQSWEVTDELASKLGMDAETLLARSHGDAWNAEMLEGANRLLDASAFKLDRLKNAAIKGGEPEKAQFLKGFFLHAAIAEQVSALHSEAGRALNILRKVSRAGLNDTKAINEAMKRIDQNVSVDELADMVGQLSDNPAALNRFVRDAVKPTWRDKAMSLWMFNLLSGPQTHAVNMMSNTLTALGQLPEHAAAAAIGSVRAGINRARGNEPVDRVLYSELGPRFVGMLQGAKEGLAAANKALRSGETSDGVSKLELPDEREAFKGVLGHIIHAPTRALTWEDEVFKGIARRMEINGLATRKARSEGLKGQALQDRIAELAANPTDEMMDKAFDYARYLTFQRPLGSAASKIQQLTENHRILKLVLPFVRTPTNLLKFAIERSPAAPVLREFRDEFRAGGAQRDLALARAMLGTGFGLTIYEMAQAGFITGGGPADENALRQLRADGWQPYSIKLGDKYYSYQRLDPLASTMGVVADLVDLQTVMTERQREKSVTLVVASIMQNLGNKTWLSGLSDAFQVYADPQRYSDSFVNRLAGTAAVPAIAAQTARWNDPILREARTPMEAIRARIPGFSESLPAKRDIYGRAIEREGSLGPDLLSPLWTTKNRHDPVVAAVMDSGARIDFPRRDVGGARLSGEDYSRYQEMAGRYLYGDIADAIRDPEWKLMSGDERKAAINRMKLNARKDARADLFGLETDD